MCNFKKRTFIESGNNAPSLPSLGFCESVKGSVDHNHEKGLSCTPLLCPLIEEDSPKTGVVATSRNSLLIQHGLVRWWESPSNSAKYGSVLGTILPGQTSPRERLPEA